MKKISILLLITLITLTACKNDTQTLEWMSFEIPESVDTVSNSGAITVNGEVVNLSWEKLEVGDTLTDTVLDMRADYFDQVETTSLSDFPGLKLIETVPSLDTPVCTMQTKQLEFATSEFPEIDFIVISNDTPFALQRFCNANGIDNLTVVSDARTREFGTQNSLLLTDYSLLTRAIMIVDENNVIQYIEYANEVTSELDLMNALAFLKNITQ